MKTKTILTAAIFAGLVLASTAPLVQAESRGATAGPSGVLEAHYHERTDMSWERCWVNVDGGDREYDSNEDAGGFVCRLA